MGTGEGVPGDPGPQQFPVMVHRQPSKPPVVTVSLLEKPDNSLSSPRPFKSQTFCNILGRWVTSRFLKATAEEAEAFSPDPNASVCVERANERCARLAKTSQRDHCKDTSRDLGDKEG